ARLLVVAGLGACANQGPPPGGPPDKAPPQVVRFVPESGAVLPGFKGDAVIQFDEVIDEMPGGGARGGGGGGGGGAAPVNGLAGQIVLSPVAGDVHVSWHRSAIHVKPAEGWKPNRVYHLELLPGIVDLRRNILKQGKTAIFSTGAPLPHAALAGTVLQWVEQRALAGAVIRAAPLPDTVAYVTVADSAGDFHLSDIPRARYRVWAIQDQNSNRQLDRREPFERHDRAPRHGARGSGTSARGSPAGTRASRGGSSARSGSRHDEGPPAAQAAPRALRPRGPAGRAAAHARLEVPDPLPRRDQSERCRRGRAGSADRSGAEAGRPGHHPGAARHLEVAMTDPRRRLPAVEALLAEPDVAALLAAHPRSLVLRAVRETIDVARANGGTAPPEGWGRAVLAKVRRLAAPSFGPVI